MRLILIVVLILGVFSTASAGEVKISWFGQSMFEIVTPAGTRIITDPHNLEAYRIKPLKADLVLMSHLHTDHINLSVIENAKEAIKHNALKRGGPGDAVIDWNLIDEKVKDVRIESVASYHDTMSGLQRGKNGIWIIDVDGLRIVHLGDLGHLLTRAQLRKLGTVDVLMVPVGGVYTLNGIEAFKVVEQVKPRRAILPMHYGTIVYDDLLPLKYFTDEAKEAEVPVEVYKVGQSLRVDARTPLPAKAPVVVLDYNGPLPEIKKKNRP